MIAPLPLWIWLAGVITVWLIYAAHIGSEIATHEPEPPDPDDFYQAFTAVRTWAKETMKNNFDFRYHWGADDGTCGDNGLKLDRLARQYIPKRPPPYEWDGDVLTAFLVGLFWPIAVPLHTAFSAGRRRGTKNRTLRKLLSVAEAELLKIKKEEGWL